MSKIKITSLVFLATVFFASNSHALTLEEYLAQVKNQNLSYASSNEDTEAFELLKKKADLVTAINLFGYAYTGFLEQNTTLSVFRYNKIYTQNYQLGFSQNSSFGVNTKLYYNLDKSTYKGLNTANSANPELAASNYQSNPILELTIPLLQNRFGSLTRATRDYIFYNNEAQKLTAQATSITSLVDAEKAYWELVASRKEVAIQQAALKSAEQILNYVSRKERMNLGEHGDVLQARALVESKKLALKLAQNEEKISARDFNKQRFIESDQVVEPLEDIKFSELENILVPRVKADNRLDTKAAEASMKQAVASAKIEEEGAKPTLNLFGSYAFNGVKKSSGEALRTSFDDKGREAAFGVNFTMPLNFGDLSDIKKGALKSASAAKLDYRQQVFDDENDWQNLVQNLGSYKENLKLARAIESAQKLKLENERRLLKQGRTSTYQILLFEQDYSNSQLTTIEIANRILDLLADQKLYGMKQ